MHSAHVGRGHRLHLGRRRLDLVLLFVFEEVLTCFLGKVLEAHDFLTTESRALHDAIVLEFVRRDDRSAGGAGVCDNPHGYSLSCEFSPTTSRRPSGRSSSALSTFAFRPSRLSTMRPDAVSLDPPMTTLFSM